MAPYLSWTRAAYVFFVLAVLAALLKLGGAGLAQQKILASEPTDPATTIELTSPENTAPETTAPETTAVERTQIEEAPAPTTSSSIQRVPKPTRPVPVKRTVAQQKRASVGEPPVFYRPSTRAALGASSNDSVPAATGPVCGDLGNFPKSSKVVFPLSDLYFNSYEDTWGAPRPQGGHEGTDLMTPAGTQEYAITDGTIVPVSGANGNGWNTLGGYTVMLRADYDVGPIEAGDLFYYAHMQKPSLLKIGTRVRAGQLIGVAGDTGQGPEITSGLFPPHLHFGWYDSTGVRTTLDSGAMNPFPLLEWLKTNGGAVAGGSDIEYCKAPQTGPPVPSAGGDIWNYPASPGVRPDLDTGSDDGRPSPVVEESASSIERAPGAEKEKPDAEKPGADRPMNRPANRPEEPASDQPTAKPRPPEITAPEITAPVVEPPDTPDVVIQPEIPRPKPQRPSAANPNSIRHWVNGLISSVTGSSNEARPNGSPRPDDKPKKHPKKHKKHPKKETPNRPKPKEQQRPELKEDTVCDAPKLRDPRTGEPCEKTTAAPETPTPAEDTTPAEPDAGESTPSETTNPAPDPPPTQTPATDTPPTKLKEPESSPEPIPGEGTTPQ